MELFVINRYTGEETEERLTDDKEKLSRILQKVKERKELESEHIKEEADLSPHEKIVPADIRTDTSVKNKVLHDSDDELEKKKSKYSEETEEQVTEFTILGTEDFNEKGKVKRVLPKWLINPCVISGSLHNLCMKVADVVELDNELKEELVKNGINYLFPVQAQVIPWILRTSSHALVTIPQDVCVSAPTGSGKTLVFVLSMIQLLKNRCRKALRALIVLPTQSLATQIHNIFEIYASNTSLDIGIIVGDKSFQNERSCLILSNSVWGTYSKIDILICTPGKLVDHLKSTEGFSLADLEYLIIDEADRVLENIQDDWLHHLSSFIQEDRRRIGLNILSARKIYGTTGPRKLLFSATLSQDPEKLERLSLFQPKLFTCIADDKTEDKTFIGKYITPDELKESCIVCSPAVKPLVLYKILQDHNYSRVLIFTGSIEAVHRLKLLLIHMFNKKLKIEEISSNQSLNERNRIVERFIENTLNVLVCTDSMARGIDLPEVDCVISYTTAKHIKTYIHRAGRTARGGASGHSITLLHPEHKSTFLNMIQLAGKQITNFVEYNDDDLEEYADVYNNALKKLKNTVGNETKVKIGIKKQKKRAHIIRTYKNKKFRKNMKV